MIETESDIQLNADKIEIKVLFIMKQIMHFSIETTLYAIQMTPFISKSWKKNRHAEGGLTPSRTHPQIGTAPSKFSGEDPAVPRVEIRACV